MFRVYETSGSQSRSSQIQACVVTSNGLAARGYTLPGSCEDGSCASVTTGVVPVGSWLLESYGTPDCAVALPSRNTIEELDESELFAPGALTVLQG